MSVAAHSPCRKTGASRHSITVIALLSLALGGVSLSAGTAAAIPQPLSSTASTTAVVDAINVRAATGQWGLQQGALDPVRNRLYIADATNPVASAITVIDLTTRSVHAQPLAGPAAATDVAVSPVDGTIYVAHNTFAGQGISVLDPDATYTADSPPPFIALPLANPERVEIGADGRLYVFNLYDRTITVIGASDSADRLKVVQVINPVPIRESTSAMNTAGTILVTASVADGAVVAIDTAANPARVLGSFPLSGTPVGVAFDDTSGQIVVTFADSDTAQWLTPSSDWTSSSVTRTVSLTSASTPVGVELTPHSVTVRPDGTALVLTRVYPTANKSFITVIPITGATYKVEVGRYSGGTVSDSRLGGTLYVTNADGTISVLSELTLTALPTTVALGSPTTYSARLSRADGHPISASLAFTDANGTSTPVPVSASGDASVAASGLGVGDSAFTVSVSSPMGISLSAQSSVLVTKAATTTTLALSSVSAVEGTELRATVTVTSGSGLVPGGTVRILGPGQALYGTASLANGTTIITTSSVPVGTTELSAVYDGNTAHLISASSAQSVVVSAKPIVAVPTVTESAPGETLTIYLDGFAPGEVVTVTMHSDPVLLGKVTMDSRGSGALITSIPRIAAGKHTIIAVGDSGRTTQFVFTVSDTAAGPTTMPSTGAEAGSPLLVGALLLGLGVALLAARRVRRRG